MTAHTELAETSRLGRWALSAAVAALAGGWIWAVWDAPSLEGPPALEAAKDGLGLLLLGLVVVVGVVWLVQRRRAEREADRAGGQIKPAIDAVDARLGRFVRPAFVLYFCVSAATRGAAVLPPLVAEGAWLKVALLIAFPVAGLLLAGLMVAWVVADWLRRRAVV